MHTQIQHNPRKKKEGKEKDLVMRNYEKQLMEMQGDGGVV